MPDHASTPTAPRTPWAGLFALTAVGLVARLLFLALEPDVALAGDEASWTDMAVSQVARLRLPFSPLRSPIIFYPPGYPYFIAALYAAFGSLDAVRWVQALIGALLVPVVGRMGVLAFSPRVGLLAAGVTALYPDLVWYSTHFWSETLFVALLWWGLERLLSASARDRLPPALASGVLLGLAALTRETALHFTPLAALWLAWPRARRGVAHAAALLLATTLTVAPWTYRNWVKLGTFIPISVFGPMNLWQGNTDLPRDTLYQEFDAIPEITGRYELAWARARQAILERQPLWLFEKLVSELPRFFGVDPELVHHLGAGAYGPRGPALETAARVLTGLPYVVVLVFFSAGLAAARLTRPRVLLLLFFIYYTALHVAAYGADRFRVPVLPVLFVLAAFGWTAWREGSLGCLSRRRKAAGLALVLLFAVLVLAGSPPPSSPAVP
jgi:4-amino-4-deoxy-L-arabinose transferase-like glycosyltransferase